MQVTEFEILIDKSDQKLMKKIKSRKTQQSI